MQYLCPIFDFHNVEYMFCSFIITHVGYACFRERSDHFYLWIIKRRSGILENNKSICKNKIEALWYWLGALGSHFIVTKSE